MLSAWAIASLTLLSGPAAVCDGLGTVAGDHRSDLETLYAQGKTYVEFRDAATRRGAGATEPYGKAQAAGAPRPRGAAPPRPGRRPRRAGDLCGGPGDTYP